MQFRIKCLIAGIGEGGDILLVVIEKLLVGVQAERGLFHLNWVLPLGEVAAYLVEFFMTHFVEAYLIEET